jgi:hypothetical protein
MNKIVIAIYWYPFNSSPSLINLAHELIDTQECIICVDHRFSTNLDSRIEEKCITNKKDEEGYVQYIAENKSKNKIYIVIKKLKSKFKKNKFAKSLLLVYGYINGLISFSKIIRQQDRKSIIIAADKFSLLPCIIAGRIPQFYYSLEVNNFINEPNALYKILHTIERAYVALKKPMIISQSERRISVISNSNKRIIIPVTSRRNKISRNSELRRTINIESDKIVIMMIGGLGYDQYGEEIINKILQLSEKYVLVIRTPSGMYEEKLIHISLNNSRLKLIYGEYSLEEVEDKIYSAGDIGIVMYRDLGINYRATAYSSGKLAAFMRSGTPCILSDFEENVELLNRYEVGSICSQIDSIEKSFEDILNNYSDISRNAHIAYENIYQYSNYYGLITREINNYSKAN